MSNNNNLVSLFIQLIKVCFGSSQQSGHGQQQQQQQHGYPQQQQHQGYPGQVNQQQQAYPGQGQPSWAGVAGQGQHGQYPPQQQYHPQQQQQHGYGQQNHQYQTNGHGPSKPHLPAGGVVGPHHPGYQNQDQVNATNERYVELRNRARHEGDEAHRCFAASQQAYQAGDGARAHDLSVQGKEHQRRQDELDDEAGAWIFNENNKASPADTIDLHGLYVKEAIERTESAILAAQRSGQDELRIIVGKGIHSQNHKAKIKPAVEDMMRKYNLSAHIDPRNTGVLIVDLNGRSDGLRSRDAGGLVDQMEKEDEGCRVM
ncbi:hypothetical protein IAU60_005905 [Kwoniella sp. DSM 27419]